jgi:osmotically-inducible protein OsmY
MNPGNIGKRNRTSAAGAALAAAAAVILLAGCTSHTDDTGQAASNEASPVAVINNVVVESPAAAPTPLALATTAGGLTTNDTNAGPGGPAGTQSAISDAVSSAIIHNTQMTGSRVNVVVDDSGVATLTGSVQNSQQKALAEKAARNTTGVNSVNNKLEINPTGGAGHTAPSNGASSGGTTTNVIVMPNRSSGADHSGYATGSANNGVPSPGRPPAAEPGSNSSAGSVGAGQDTGNSGDTSGTGSAGSSTTSSTQSTDNGSSSQ